MIDKLDTVKDPETERVLSHIHTQAIGTVFTDTAPVAAKVPSGKLIIYDNGTTREGYLRTGKDTVVKWTLTVV